MLLGPWVELFDANDCRVFAFVLRIARRQQFVTNFTGAQDDSFGAFGVTADRPALRGSDRRPKSLNGAGGFAGAQVAFRRHQDQRFAERAHDLAAQDVEMLRGGAAVGDLHVIVGAQLQEAFETGRRVFWTSAFLAVRQHHHQALNNGPIYLPMKK